MRAWVLALALGIALSAQQQQQPPPKEEEPPEEDTSLKPKEYSFNPLQADKELRIGEYYFKKKSYRAAANRFREATRWNPNFADAFLRLGDAEEKLNDRKAAQEAYAKYLELNPGAKDAESVRKKLAPK
ncbi:MAG TPA: tetratricopeptide repeat protein [Bryobacteraceae bacterium]|nr:tetratricopeptide repeat protein [Bryobacteraceae bacterium]